jgi:hypothetical protein
MAYRPTAFAVLWLRRRSWLPIRNVACQLVVRRFGVAQSGHSVNNLDCKCGTLSADANVVPRISLVGIFHHQAGLVAAPAAEAAISGFSHWAEVAGMVASTIVARNYSGLSFPTKLRRSIRR